jgi:hypothetical protein
MYKKPTNPKATSEVTAETVRKAPEREIAQHLNDFELWLENELIQLEAKYASFTTTTSNRKFFEKNSRNVS